LSVFCAFFFFFCTSFWVFKSDHVYTNDKESCRLSLCVFIAPTSRSLCSFDKSSPKQATPLCAGFCAPILGFGTTEITVANRVSHKFEIVFSSSSYTNIGSFKSTG
jgi:hypothetical protein